MKNPFRALGNNPFGLTDAQRYYPFKTEAEKNAAVDDTLDIIGPLFGAAGKAGLKLWALIAGSGEAIDGMKALYDRVLAFLSKTFDETIESLDKDEILHAGGRAGAKSLATNLKKKYDLDFPITDLYNEFLPEELGEWVAGMVNEKAREKTGVDMNIFTNFFPPDTIIPELDQYLCFVIGEKLNIQIDSVLQNNNLLIDIKEKIAQKMLDEFYDQVGQLRINAVRVIKTQFADYSIEDYETAINALEVVIPVFEAKIIAGIKDRIPIFKNIKVVPERTRINNKLRQRAYRLTHREQRIWVVKD